MPFQPTKPIVPIRDTDPDAAELAPVIQLRPVGTSRYERNSSGLPRLEDDPDWSPPTFDLTSPIIDEPEPRWFERLFR